MRMLGLDASVSTFRWDIIYLLAQLTSDTRPGVAALAPPIQALLDQLSVERAAFEAAEDAMIIATALLNKNDKHRDSVLIEAGGVARAADKAVYKVLFGKLNPSHTARLAIDEESVEVARILGELDKLAEDHPIRAAYRAELLEAEAAVKAAGGQADEAATALALARSRLDRFKLECDTQRLVVHGQLVALLKDKAEADAFFRPGTGAPTGKKKKDPEPEDSTSPA